MKCAFRSGVVAAFLLVLFGASGEAAVRHVLLLQSLDRGNLTLDHFTGNFRAAIDRSASEPITITQFVVNPSGFLETPEQAIADFLRAAFANHPKPDLVITTGGPAAVFARKYREQLFPESPLLLAAFDQRFMQNAPLSEHETSVAVLNDMPGIVDDILQVLPRTSNVFVVIGPGPLGSFWQKEVERDFQRFGNRVSFTWSGDLSFAEILKRVATLPPNAAIFYLTFGSDAAGGAYAEQRILSDIHAVANAPLFGSQGALLGHGIVGGRLLSADELGQNAADAALRILGGESPSRVRTPLQMPGAPVFDSRELTRWRIDEGRLPPGSIVRFQDPGLWDRFKWVIIGGSSLVIAQGLMIGALLVNRVKRRRAEKLLHQNIADLDTARAALSNLSRRLMETQEQERTRVARELHDDVSQRMTFMTIDLARLRGMLPHDAAEAREQVQGLYDAILALGRDITRISHRLHASTADVVGLSAAASILCKEVSSHHDLEVECVHENVPGQLPEGVAIGLFRVLQEALSNAAKHAGARRCKVTLRGLPDALILEVSDDGRGFDAGAAPQSQRLGLVTMQERLKLLDGDLEIESRLGAGTRVRAHVPLQPDPVPNGQAVSSSADRSVPSTTA
jgi:signal transduction histidine kinase